MTEHNKSTETDNHKETTDIANEHTQSTSRTKKRSGLVGSAIAIAIIIIIGGGLYYTHQQNIQLANENNDLKQQMSDLIEQQKTEKMRLDDLLSAHSALNDKTSEYQRQLDRRMQELQAHVTALSSSDVKNWLIAQADFMVKMAGRKLWNDHDPVTAAVLLKSADSSLAEMNDPSLLDIRKSINNDISKLATINQVDYDGIILRLNQLSNEVDNLRVADIHRDDAMMDEDNGEVSGDISDWQQNLSRSWKSFTNNFIMVRARDGSETPLLAPNQDIYLRENIRSQLLIAAQAVPRYQEQTYKQSLDQVSTWIRAYFDVDDPATKAFLSEVDTLLNQHIAVEMPDSLESQPKLEKVMQTRVRSLLAQASESVLPETKQPEAQPTEPQPSEKTPIEPSTEKSTDRLAKPTHSATQES